MPRYSTEDLLSALRLLADELGRPPTATEMNTHDDTPSVTTYRSRFGSWNEALEAAGLDTAGYSEDELLTILQDFAETLGRRPTSTDIADHDELPNLSTFQDHFGTWNGALEAAELGINEVYAHDSVELKQELARLARELGRVPSELDMDEQGRFSATAYRDEFGSWKSALAELNLSSPPPRSYIPNRDLITELQNIANYGDERRKTFSPTKRQIIEESYSYDVYVDRFGSLAEALVKAGLDPTRHITRDEIIEEIQALADTVGCTPGGKAPTIEALREHGSISRHAVTQEFETWNEAVAAAGFIPNEGRPANTTDITHEDVVDDVLAVAAQCEGIPTEEMYETHGQYGTTTIERRYGSWNRFLKLVGVTPRHKSPGRWARGTPASKPSVDRSPGSPTNPRVDQCRVAIDLPAVRLSVGDIIIDWHSPLRTFEIIDIQVEATALTPAWSIVTHPTVLDQPYTRTLYGDELCDCFAEGTMGLFTQMDTRVFEIVQSVADRVDGHLTKEKYDAHRDEDHISAEMICTHYDWRTVKQSAGLSTTPPHGTLSKADAIAAVQTVAERVDGPLTFTEYSNHRDDDHPAGKTLVRKFGWNDLKQEAGLVLTLSSHSDTSKEEAIVIVQDIDERVEGSLTIAKYNDLREDHQPTGETLSNKFGWNDLKEAAGLDITQKGRKEISKAVAIAIVQDIDKRVEGSLTIAKYNDLREDHQPTGDTLSKKFGWNDLKEEADLDIGHNLSSRDVSKADAIAAVQTVAERVEGLLSIKKYNAHRSSDHPNGNTLSAKFGWNNIKAEAGLETAPKSGENS